MNDTSRIQSVRNAWINALRNEVLRVHSLDIAKVAAVGVWIATFADADGSNAYPSAETLAALAGCSRETVGRAVRVLTAVGMLQRARRPNASSMYQLVMPMGRPPWGEHMHLFTRTRQRAAYERKRKEAAAAIPDGVSGRGPDSVSRGVPDSVNGRAPGSPDSVSGRHRTASVDDIRTASVDAPTSTYLPTVGTHSDDQDAAGHLHQPQVRAREPDRAAEPTGIEAFRAARRTRGTPPHTQPA